MAKPTATKTKSSAPPANKAAGKRVSDVRELRHAAPTHDEIAARAFELYAARGGVGGDALGDWLAAEGELRSGH